MKLPLLLTLGKRRCSPSNNSSAIQVHDVSARHLPDVVQADMAAVDSVPLQPLVAPEVTAERLGSALASSFA